MVSAPLNDSMRDWRYIARGIWPEAEWIEGRGAFASLAHCRVLTVRLHPSRAEADEAKEGIDRRGCGGFCTRNHEVIEMRRGDSLAARRYRGGA